jgi:hypothetical protein
MTEAMLAEHLARNFEPDPRRGGLKVETWTRRRVDAYPDFQSVTQNHRLWIS